MEISRKTFKHIHSKLSEITGMAYAGAKMTECDKAEELFMSMEGHIDELVEIMDIAEKQEIIDRKYDDSQKLKEQEE